jgi:hypothetical protein
MSSRQNYLIQAWNRSHNKLSQSDRNSKRRTKSPKGNFTDWKNHKFDALIQNPCSLRLCGEKYFIPLFFPSVTILLRTKKEATVGASRADLGVDRKLPVSYEGDSFWQVSGDWRASHSRSEKKCRDNGCDIWFKSNSICLEIAESSHFSHAL